MDDRHVILYVGNPDCARRLASLVEAEDWHVLPATQWREALGKYVAYWPDTVVIDAAQSPDLAETVYFHLRSVAADPMLVLADAVDTAGWRTAIGTDVRVLNRRTDDDDVIAAIRALHEDRYDWCDRQTA